MPITSAQVTGLGTDEINVTLQQTLDDNTAYYIKVASTALVDVSDNRNPFPGIGMTTDQEWVFTTGDYTAPSLISTVPSSGSAQMTLTGSLQLRFDEAVTVGTSGYIEIYHVDDGLLVESILADSALVSVEGSTATIHRTINFVDDTNYFVLVQWQINQSINQSINH